MAEDLSRGISVQDLIGRWRDGQEFLRLPEELWPQPDTAQAPPEEHMGLRRVEAVCQMKIAVNLIDPQAFSSWRRLIRVTARIKRLAEKIRLRKHAQEGKQSPLTPDELLQAELFWIRDVQKSLYNRLAKGKFKTLSPFIDDKGIIRVGRRLDKAIVSYERKPPALLPTANWISLLITRHMHQFGHPGVATTTAKIRQQYWILKANKLSKLVKSRCVSCKDMAHKADEQLMADLPDVRLAPHTPPLYYTSCDYFVPYNVKIGRNKEMKHYDVIFTCLSTRAVHLELAMDLSTMEFMQVLRRFFSIRGQPALMISDNGFSGSLSHLQLLIKMAAWNLMSRRARKG